MVAERTIWIIIHIHINDMDVDILSQGRLTMSEKAERDVLLTAVQKLLFNMEVMEHLETITKLR